MHYFIFGNRADLATGKKKKLIGRWWWSISHRMSQLRGFVFLGDVPVSFSGSFPKSDSVPKYGDTVLTGINKNYTELLLNFHLTGDQIKIGWYQNTPHNSQQCKQMAQEVCGSRRAVHFHMLWNVSDLHLSHLGTNCHFLFSFQRVLSLALLLSISVLLFPFCCHIVNAFILSMLKCTGAHSSLLSLSS